jgi:hypothetical protein
LKAGFGDLRTRLDAFTARFNEHARRPPGPSPGPVRGADTDDYWHGVRDLFTRDVTEQGLRDLVSYETHDAWRYFSREIDFGRLRSKPWYKRWPLTA